MTAASSVSHLSLAVQKTCLGTSQVPSREVFGPCAHPSDAVGTTGPSASQRAVQGLVSAAHCSTKPSPCTWRSLGKIPTSGSILLYQHREQKSSFGFPPGSTPSTGVALAQPRGPSPARCRGSPVPKARKGCPPPPPASPPPPLPPQTRSFMKKNACWADVDRGISLGAFLCLALAKGGRRLRGF